jgi:AraC-like DNA-binding protein
MEPRGDVEGIDADETLSGVVVSETDRSLQVDLADSSIRMTVRMPGRRLRPHIPALECYDEDARRPHVRTHSAMPRVAMLIDLGEPLAVRAATGHGDWVRAPGGFVAGLSDAPAATRHCGTHRGIQVDLSPLAARRLFGVPLSQLRGRVVPLTDLLPRSFRRLCAQLGEAPDGQTRLDRLERFLSDALAADGPQSQRVAGAVARIEACGGRLDVGGLAPWLGISQKHLIALFHDHVGVPPKLFARLVRHERALTAARSHPERSWAEIALDAGFCDQSHLTREVRGFTGSTPTALRADEAAPPGRQEEAGR